MIIYSIDLLEIELNSSRITLWNFSQISFLINRWTIMLKNAFFPHSFVPIGYNLVFFYKWRNWTSISKSSGAKNQHQERERKRTHNKFHVFYVINIVCNANCLMLVYVVNLWSIGHKASGVCCRYMEFKMISNININILLSFRQKLFNLFDRYCLVFGHRKLFALAKLSFVNRFHYSLGQVAISSP